MMMSLIKIVVVTFILTIIHSVDCNQKEGYLVKSESKGDDTLLLVSWKERKGEIIAVCDVISDRDQIKEALKSVKEPTETISAKQMREYIEDCDIVNDMRPEEGREILAAKGKKNETNSETTTPGYDGIPVIFPGTKWCGAGDRAKHYDDLGLHQDTDRCCRAHDLCNDTLAPGETRNKLKNSSPFTKLSCQCDEDFYKCLDRVNSVTSNTIGNMYFNILRRECYKHDYPDTKKCKKYRTFLKLKCIEYEKNTKASKVYKWVPAKKYKKIPFPGPLTVTLPNILPF